MGVLAGGTRGAGADDRAAVGNAGVIAVELFLRNEGDRGVVVGEVVRHRDDGLFDGGRIGALLGHNEALAGVLLARGQLRVGAGAHGIQRLGHGHRVLAGVGHAGNAADGVGVPLGDAAAPEGVVGAVGHDGVGVNARDREHARIPAHRDDGHVPRLAGHRVDGGEVRRDVGVGVEGVDHVVERSGCRGLLGQVGGRAAGEHEHVDVVGVGGQLRGGPDGDVLAERVHAGRVAASEHAHQFHVVVGGDGQFNAAAEVAIAENADADGVQWCLLGCSLSGKAVLRGRCLLWF